MGWPEDGMRDVSVILGLFPSEWVNVGKSFSECHSGEEVCGVYSVDKVTRIFYADYPSLL